MPTAVANVVGNFRLSFQVDNTVMVTGGPITGEAQLWIDSPTSTSVSGSGAGLIAFRFANGDVVIDPAWPASCRPYSIGADAPFSTAITKSGSYSDSDPQASFLRDFFSTSEIILPAGSWSITAIANVYEGPTCEPPVREITATIDVLSQD
jgi:hypothetical protein